MRNLDHRLSRPIHNLVLGPLDYPLLLPGMLFGTWGMPFTIGLVFLLVSGRLALLMTAAALTTVAITGPLKRLIGRERPEPLQAPRRLGVRKLVDNPAFPSGDSAQAAMVATLLLVAGPFPGRGGLLFVLIVPFCMFARVYYGAHWIGDTIAGAAVGALVGALYLYLFSDFVGI